MHDFLMHNKKEVVIIESEVKVEVKNKWYCTHTNTRHGQPLFTTHSPIETSINLLILVMNEWRWLPPPAAKAPPLPPLVLLALDSMVILGSNKLNLLLLSWVWSFFLCREDDNRESMTTDCVVDFGCCCGGGGDGCNKSDDCGDAGGCRRFIETIIV